MPDDPLDLPNRTISDRNPEVFRPVSRRDSPLTERQHDEVIRIYGKAASDVGEILKGVVSIVGMRAKTEQDVARIEAETKHVEAVTRAEIDRIMAHGKNLHSRAEAAHKLLVQLTEMVKLIPEADSSSRGSLIHSIGSILESVLHEKKA